MQSIILSFKIYLWQAGYSEGTRNMLPPLVAEFLDQQQIGDIYCVEQGKVRSFCAYLQHRPLKKRSGALSEMMIAHYVYALKTFFTWLENTGQLVYNPISGMRFRRPRKNAREPLSNEEIEQLFAVCDTLKERAALHLFYSCGLRRSEGQALNTGDVHFKSQLLYVREGKGSKRRVIPLADKVNAALQAYWEEERQRIGSNKISDAHAFILNSVGNRMSGEGYNKLLKQLLARAELPSIITLHHLRHSIATHLLQGGMGMEYVRDFLGHSYLESTQIYAKVSTQQLRLL
ncbi:MAG: tyrosine-type recombinase/integrase [Chitinophagaceae bacterium]|nr:tyrosine-type recombinase/integrase [Chitinophagaceae bacterium]